MRTYEDEADEIPEDTFDEYSTRDKLQQKSFYDRYGFNELEGRSVAHDDGNNLKHG